MRRRQLYKQGKYNYEDQEFVAIEGILYATKNFKASNITDIGQYVQWADTKGYYQNEVGTLKQFSENDYKYYENGITTKYGEDGIVNIYPEDDIIFQNSNNGFCCMMNDEYINWLLTYTNQEVVTNYQNSGIDGILFTYVDNSSAQIFLPFGGAYYNGTLLNNSYYWLNTASVYDSSTISQAALAYSINNNSNTEIPREYGCCIRGIKNKDSETTRKTVAVKAGTNTISYQVKSGAQWRGGTKNSIVTNYLRQDYGPYAVTTEKATYTANKAGTVTYTVTQDWEYKILTYGRAKCVACIYSEAEFEIVGSS